MGRFIPYLGQHRKGIIYLTPSARLGYGDAGVTGWRLVATEKHPQEVAQIFILDWCSLGR